MGNASLIMVLGIIAIACVLGWWVLSSPPEGSSGQDSQSGTLTEINEMLYQKVITYSVSRMGRECWKTANNPDGTQGVWDASTEVNDRYEELWKHLFIRKNKLSEEYFQKHISVLDTGISTDQSYLLSLGTRGEPVKTKGREYYNVMYRVSVDWAEISAIDYFMIKDNRSDEYLTAAAVEENAFIPEDYETFPRKRSQISLFLPADKLGKTFYEAAQSLRNLDKAVTQYIEPQYLYLNELGEIELYGSGCIDSKENAGIEGHYNVNNGKGSSNQKYCWIA